MPETAQKNEEQVGRIRGWLEAGVPQGPYSLQVHPTMACDLNCVFCRRQDQLRDYYAKNREIPNERYLAIMREALEMGARVVIVKGGGEPLLRKSLMLELAPLVKRAGAFGNIVTNGTHLDEDLSRMFVACGWDQITISLDGPDAPTHDGLRGKSGAFERIMGNVRRIRKMKETRGVRLPLMGFHCVLTTRNYERLGDMIELAKDNGVGHVELDSMSLRFESTRPLLMDAAAQEDFQARLPGWIERLSRYGLSHNFEQFRRAEYVRRPDGNAPFYDKPRPQEASAAVKVPCYYPFYQASITPAGGIVPCCYAEETHRSKVSLHEVSFREAWLRRDPQDYRDSMVTGAMQPFCKDCTAMYADNNEQIRRWISER